MCGNATFSIVVLCNIALLGAFRWFTHLVMVHPDCPLAMGSDSSKNEVVPCPDDDDASNWAFALVPVDSHVDFCACFRWDFDTTPDVYRSAKAAVPEDDSGAFSLTLQNLNGITERNSTVDAKSVT